MEKVRKEHIIATVLWWTLVILPLILLLTISCADTNHTIEGNDRDYITISPFIEGGMGRFTGNEFEEDDAIGLYVVPYLADNTTPGNIATSDYAQNVQHVYHESSWLLPSGGKLAWPSSLLDVDIYSYYPYNVLLAELDPLDYLFSVEVDQQTAVNYLTSDFLWSKKEKVTPTREPVELIFSHRLSKVKVNVRSEVDLTAGVFSNAIVSILNTTPGGSVNLSDGSVSASAETDVADIMTFRHATPALDFDLSTEGIIIPQTARQDVPFIEIDLPDDGTRYHYIPSENIVFEPGTERTINITITRLGLSVTVSQITEWQPTEVIEGEIGTSLPLVLDLESLDWDASRIHHIYNEGVWIADASREYLKGTGIDAQAIVIYTVDAEGSLDVSNGFVAQVMSYNSSTYQYTPSTSSIHGGSVVWASGNSISSYTAGSGAAMNKIEFRDDGTLAIAPDTYIATLDTSPYQIVDVEGNRYAIVKVARQYWMAENLRVQHYNDGTELTAYYYNDDPANRNTYGMLYTWDTMMSDNGIAPTGWKPFSYDDYYTMFLYLTPNAGRKLKANILWASLGVNNTDVAGYSAIPGGYRNTSGTYGNLSSVGNWWTTTRGAGNPTIIRLTGGSSAIGTPADYAVTYALSVRLIRE